MKQQQRKIHSANKWEKVLNILERLFGVKSLNIDQNNVKYLTRKVWKEKKMRKDKIGFENKEKVFIIPDRRGKISKRRKQIQKN